VPKRARRTDEILRRVGLSDKAEAYARQLSGGMKRRLLIAKALVHNPPVLVLDEPTAGVDIELRQMLWAYVRELNAAGTTIILTTHYLEEAEAMCDRIGIINKGKLIAEAATEALVARLDRKALVITPEAAVADLPPVPEGVEVERRPGGALAFSYHRSATSAEAVLDLLRREGIAVRDVAVEEPHLEDVFVALTSSRSAA
jgi:ABC-2 type transport system ATP-binding protein